MKIKNIEKIPEEVTIIKYFKSIIKIPEEVTTIYHYTTIEALTNGIIVNKAVKDKEICLWASNCEYMNDPDEVKSGYQFLNKIVGSYLDNKENLPDVSEYDYTIKDKIFITSFSTQNDSLPMWKMYGKDGKGIVLGIDKEIISKVYEPLIYKCIYNSDKHIREISQILNPKKITRDSNIDNSGELEKGLETALSGIIGVINDILTTLAYSIFLVKNEDYSYEDEIRLFTIAEKNIAFRCKNDLIIPYINIFLPKEALKEVWIGPTSDLIRTKKSLRTFLDAKGFNNVKIFKSNIHYRST